MTAAACDPPEYDAEADFLERTPKHFLDPDPQDSTNCLECGDVNGYGGLHLAEPVEEPPEAVLLRCDRCGHVRHSRRCDAAVTRFPGSVPCGCAG